MVRGDRLKGCVADRPLDIGRMDKSHHTSPHGRPVCIPSKAGLLHRAPGFEALERATRAGANKRTAFPTRLLIPGQQRSSHSSGRHFPFPLDRLGYGKGLLRIIGDPSGRKPCMDRMIRRGRVEAIQPAAEPLPSLKGMKQGRHPPRIPQRLSVERTQDAIVQAHRPDSLKDDARR